MKLELKNQWNLIAEEIIESGFTLSDLKLLPTGARTTWGEILVGIDSRNRRHVLVAVPDNAKEDREDSSQGISIEVRPYIINRREVLYCDIACKLAELNELFTVVAQDIIDNLLHNPDASPYPIALTVLERWRQLLERAPTRRLSQEKLSGLMGELLMLSKLAERSPDVLDHWVGPGGARHDFVSHDINIEVKASVKANGRHVTIQSLEQLEVSESQHLYLYFVKFRVPTGTGITLPEIIDDLIRKGINSIDFYQKLLAVGYHPDERKIYLNMPLEFVESFFYRVDDEGFPKLTPQIFIDGMPQGIDTISYKINLDTPGLSPIDEHSIHTLISEMIAQ